ncbi:hypothetical protein ES703_118746 [subsurface metagenome]
MVLIITLVGGTGTIGGIVLGSFIFVFVPEFLHVVDVYRYVIFGVLIMISIIFNPEGMWPRLTSLWNRLDIFVRRRLA